MGGGEVRAQIFTNLLLMDFYQVLDNTVSEMKWRFEKSSVVSIDFEFLSGYSLFVKTLYIFKK